jgi:hypothetical protein
MRMRSLQAWRAILAGNSNEVHLNSEVLQQKHQALASAATIAFPIAEADIGFWPVKMSPSSCTLLAQQPPSTNVAPRADSTCEQKLTNNHPGPQARALFRAYLVACRSEACMNWQDAAHADDVFLAVGEGGHAPPLHLQWRARCKYRRSFRNCHC